MFEDKGNSALRHTAQSAETSSISEQKKKTAVTEVNENFAY